MHKMALVGLGMLMERTRQELNAGVSGYERTFVNAFGILGDELPRHRGEGQRHWIERFPLL